MRNEKKKKTRVIGNRGIRVYEKRKQFLRSRMDYAKLIESMWKTKLASPEREKEKTNVPAADETRRSMAKLKLQLSRHTNAFSSLGRMHLGKVGEKTNNF